MITIRWYMNMSIKNMWSLDPDETIVATHIKEFFSKNKIQDYELFFPINKQLKKIDLNVYNLKTKKTITIQVKSSRSYEDKGYEYSWHQVHVDKIDPKTVDIFVFVSYFSVITGKSRMIKPEFIVIPTSKLLDIVKKNKTIKKNGEYHFSFNLDGDYFGDYSYLQSHINPENGIDFSKYLNKFELVKN